MKFEKAKEISDLILRLEELEYRISTINSEVYMGKLHVTLALHHATGPNAGEQCGEIGLSDINDIRFPLTSKWEMEKAEIVKRLKELGVEL